MKLIGKLQKVLALVVVVVLLFGTSCIPVQMIQAATDKSGQVPSPTEEKTILPANRVSSGDIVILYDNDVHCAVDGYASIAALKKDMKEKTDYFLSYRMEILHREQPLVPYLREKILLKL